MPDGRVRASRRGGPLGAIWTTLAIFLVLLAVLAVRLASGEDPALLARRARAPRPARQVLVRRIYERVVVVHLPATAKQPSGGSSQQVSSEGGGTAAAPIATRTS